jgi:prepilin-type processing-associated H-X9-DG protein
MEQPALSQAAEAWMNNTTDPNGGKSWWIPGRETRIPNFMCPSDPLAGKNITAGVSVGDTQGGTLPELSQGFHGNYVVNTGSTPFNPGSGLNGEPADPGALRLNGVLFAKSRIKIGDIKDGAAFTLAASELILVRDVLGPTTAGADVRGRYYNPIHGGAFFTTVQPPNTPVKDVASQCQDTPPWTPCLRSSTNLAIFARSYHKNGVNVAFADGSARFLSNSIRPDAWKAMGTRAGNESVPTD